MRRRSLLAGGLAAMALPALGAPPLRIVALEWGIVSMLLSLGIAPVGMPEIAAYGRWVGEPAIPAGVADLGVKTEPNLEAIAQLRPDLILTSPLNRTIVPLLAGIAPVREVAIFTEAAAPIREAARSLRDLGALLGRSSEAEAETARTEATFAATRSAIAARASSPVLLFAFLDAQHVRIFGRTSLFGDVAERVGLANAWTRPTNLWGFSIVGVAEIAPFADARLLVIEPTPPGVIESLGGGSLWSRLAPVRAGRVASVPAAWQFGDLVAARRFAGFLARTLPA